MCTAESLLDPEWLGSVRIRMLVSLAGSFDCVVGSGVD